MKLPTDSQKNEKPFINLSTRQLLVLSLPMIVASALEPIAEMVDTALLMRSIPEVVGVLAASNIIVGSAVCVFNFLVYGLAARVARSYGASDTQSVGAHIALGLWVALFGGVIVGSFLLLGLESIFISAFDLTGTELTSAMGYGVPRVIGLPFHLVMVSALAGLRGMGHLISGLMVGAFVTALNIGLSSFFLFYMDLGVEAVAWGTTISYVVGMILCLVKLNDLGGLSSFSLVREKFDRSFLSNFGADSWNLFLRTACLRATFFLAATVISRFSLHDLAAHQIALQIWFLSALILDGYAITATTMIGQLDGRKDQNQLQKIGQHFLMLSVATGGFLGCLLFFSRDFIFSIFAVNQQIAAPLGDIWIILSFSQFINGYIYLLDGYFFGLRRFGELRRGITIGFFLVFLPFLFFSHSITMVWLGILSLNIQRCYTLWRMRRIVPV